MATKERPVSKTTLVLLNDITPNRATVRKVLTADTWDELWALVPCTWSDVGQVVEEIGVPEVGERVWIRNPGHDGCVVVGRQHGE